MRTRVGETFLVLGLLLLGLSCATPASPSPGGGSSPNTIIPGEDDWRTKVTLTTSSGNIVIELFEAEAPETAANFLAYVAEGFYENTVVHQLLPGQFFVLGGFTVDLFAKNPTRPPVTSEASNGLTNAKGTVAMARQGNDPNSATTEIIFNLADNGSIFDPRGSEPALAGYTVFGRVYGEESMQVVEEIGSLEVRTRGAFSSIPAANVTVEAAAEGIVGDMEDPAADSTRVRIATSAGDIVIDLMPEQVPITVGNFLDYVDSDFYDGMVFHRIISDFVIQAGGFRDENDTLIRVEPNAPIMGEAELAESNLRGTISMALVNGDVNSGTSQWFINLVDNSRLDSVGHTVFGNVVEGLDVVDFLATVETTSKPVSTGAMAQDVPVEPVTIFFIERILAN